MMPIPKQTLQNNRRCDQKTDRLMDSPEMTTMWERDDDPQRTAQDNDSASNSLDEPMVLE